MIFWGIIVLTVFGCAASVFEFFFGIVNAVDNYLGTILDTASSFGVGSHAEGLAKFSAVHDRMSVFTRLCEILTVAGWIVYVVGLSRFRNAQHTERGRWLTGSLYTACWLGLIGIACTFLGSFLGMFELLFTFAGWVLNLISLFKFRSAFNQLYMEDGWSDTARQGAYYTGEYMYVKNKRPIQLNGHLVDDGDRLVLEEYVGDKMTGRFDGILGRSGYSGTWTSADGSRSYSFSVSPN